MIINAIALAVVTYLVMVLIYFKLPKTAKRFIIKGDMFTDIGAAFLTYMFLGGTATALIAAGIVGIAISITLTAAKAQDSLQDVEYIRSLNQKTFKNK